MTLILYFLSLTFCSHNKIRLIYFFYINLIKRCLFVFFFGGGKGGGGGAGVKILIPKKKKNKKNKTKKTRYRNTFKNNNCCLKQCCKLSHFNYVMCFSQIIILSTTFEHCM